MESQTSILSFLQKPQPKVADRNAAPSPGNGSPPSLLEARAADPPPEKSPCHALPGNSDSGGGSSSIFSAIKHKFVKADPKETPRDIGSIEPDEVLKDGSVSVFHGKDDVPSSETLAVRPVVPGFKRFQLESAACRVLNDRSLLLPPN